MTRTKKETTEETILRQRKAGKKSGSRYICKECDFIFYTTTFQCRDWELHKKETMHQDHYEIELIKETEGE